MGWKDYFYFQKRDKTAIILLLILIVLSCGIYIVTKPDNKEKVKLNTESKHNSDVQPDVQTQKDEIKNIKERIEPKQSRYPYQEKLKPGETIELNSADTSNLKKVPGIGIGFANKIVKYRSSLGGYVDIAQLKEVWGMDDDLYNKITPYITIIPKAKMIKINSADFQELNKHPYINYKQAQIITDIRERKGKIESIQRLTLLEEFTEKDITQLKPYLTFD
ncbi:helix-hairpin-helix domain-containing protein [Dysgonomonas sp. Marseille-P4677]|uniref:ComEA family DNA-binding protein n=1 Tax=Dysgonomonas sp. Marseille-P4677 TaxID=2364790 RepID=UPI001911395D|nr:helix-hairpin-helix domain-containing protein [Dysgonomonas sp. Marseille-P4677]MBK5719293.1 helix-hairpin-helix domain-containing protein [Dysgonomonas sp. Marseille-P4677]